jgi:hypothetical protein
MNIGIIGCGCVAELYGKTIVNYPELKRVGAYDSDRTNLTKFCLKMILSSY